MKSFAVILCSVITLAASAQKSDKKIRDTVTLRIYYLLLKKEIKSVHPYRADTMLLDIGKNHSRFYDPARLKRDSAIAYLFRSENANAIKEINVLSDENAGRIADMPGSVASNTLDGESYQIIKNKDGSVNVFDSGNSFTTKLQHEDKVGKLNWQLEDGMDTISTYACQKATLKFRGRNYNAWFTTDIPISEGPWKFSGLPGLILKVEDEDQLFSFTMIGLTQPKNPMPFEIDKSDYLMVTREEYKKQILKRGLGMSANFTDGVLLIGKTPGKYTPLLMELE